VDSRWHFSSAPWASSARASGRNRRDRSGDLGRSRIQEGYFSLGQDTTLVVKPGTDLHKFLTRQRGKKITITMTETGGRTLSRIDR
jgi:hypothetical protein